MKRQRFVEPRGSSSSSEIRSFPSPRAVKPGVLFLKAADNVPAAINTYARVNTSRLSPRVKQLEGLLVSLPRVSSRSSIASSSFKLLPHLPLAASSSFSTYFFPFYFPLFFPSSSFCPSFFPRYACPLRERRRDTTTNEEEGWRGGGEKYEKEEEEEKEERKSSRNIPGRHFSCRNAESLRSRGVTIETPEMFLPVPRSSRRADSSVPALL